MTLQRLAPLSLVALLLKGCALSSDIVGAGMRIEQERLNGAARYRSASMIELSRKSPCCDNLSSVHPQGRADGDRPYQVSLGAWPSTDVVEIDGFRTYYTLLSLEPVKAEGQILRLVLGLGTQRFSDNGNGQPAHDVLVPAVTFLDRERRIIGPTTVAVPKDEQPNPSANAKVPVGSAFAVVHTSAQALATKGLYAYVAPQTSAAPIGGAFLVSRSRGYVAQLLPQYTGSITISLQ